MGACIGVDVSKHHLDWNSGGSGNVARVPNTPADVRRLMSKLRSLEVALIVVESTGGYERVLTEALSGADCRSPWSIRGGCDASGKDSANSPRRTRSMPAFWRSTASEPGPVEGRSLAPDSVR